jgi:hypothetical protein
MLDSDMATLYSVQPKVLNQTVRRNIERFPKDFMFQLTDGKAACLRSHSVLQVRKILFFCEGFPFPVKSAHLRNLWIQGALCFGCGREPR